MSEIINFDDISKLIRLTDQIAVIDYKTNKIIEIIKYFYPEADKYKNKEVKYIKCLSKNIIGIVI